MLPAACIHSGPADPPQRLQTAPGFGLSVSSQASGLSPCHTAAGRARRGSTARPGAAWHRRPLRPVPVPIPIPIPVPPGTAGTPASAASSGPAPAAHPCASAGRCGAARHGDDPHGPPLQAPSPPYPIDDDPGDVLVRRVESVRQLSVAVHQGGPQLPLRAGGDAACIQLRGVQLQALCSGIRASQSAFGLGGTLKIGEGSRGAGGSAIQPSDSWWRRSPTPCRR